MNETFFIVLWAQLFTVINIFTVIKSMIKITKVFTINFDVISPVEEPLSLLLEINWIHFWIRTETTSGVSHFWGCCLEPLFVLREMSRPVEMRELCCIRGATWPFGIIGEKLFEVFGPQIDF